MGGLGDALGFVVEIGAVVVFYVIFIALVMREKGSQLGGPPLTYDNPSSRQALSESAARVQERAASLGLSVLRYTPVLRPVSASYGALVDGQPDGPMTLEFKGEIATIQRVTLAGLPTALNLSMGGAPGMDRTGDTGFDGTFKLRCRMWDTAGALSHTSREHLTRLAEMKPRSLTLRGGVLTFELDEDPSGALVAAGWRGPLLELIRALRTDLQRQSPGESWLIDAARSDPDEGARARAIALLAEVPLAGPGRAVVEAGLHHPSEQVRLAAALALKNTLILNDITATTLEIAVEQDTKRTMEGLEAAGAEVALARLLRVDPVSAAAAGALGRVGTVASVPALRQISEGGLLSTPASRAARQAIGEIQSRIHGAEAGQVSVMAPPADAGALTVSAAAGQVSETSDPGRHRAGQQVRDGV